MTRVPPVAASPDGTVASPIPAGRRLPRPQQRHLPVLATLTLLALMYGMGLINYDGFSDTQVFLNVFVDNAFLLVWRSA